MCATPVLLATIAAPLLNVACVPVVQYAFMKQLLTVALRWQLGDFGLSRVLDPAMTHVSTKSYGTLSYMPAEVLKDGRLTPAADVYSFAMMMWELFSSQPLFDGCTMAQVRDNLRPEWALQLAPGPACSGWTQAVNAGQSQLLLES